MTFARIVAWLLALEFFLKQNQFFGWNARPQSEAELIADGITLLLIAFATALTVYEPRNAVSVNIKTEVTE